MADTPHVLDPPIQEKEEGIYAGVYIMDFFYLSCRNSEYYFMRIKLDGSFTLPGNSAMLSFLKQVNWPTNSHPVN